MGTRAVMEEPVQPRTSASGGRAAMSTEEKEAVLNRHNNNVRRLALLKAVASLARCTPATGSSPHPNARTRVHAAAA